MAEKDRRDQMVTPVFETVKKYYFLTKGFAA